MLPHEDLASHYDRLTWIYVCRTWDEDEKDLEAGRTHDRFGVTSWPQLFVIDPRSDAILRRTGRSVRAIQSAFEAALPRVEPLPPDDLAAALERLGDPPEADDRSLAGRLRDMRPLVRILALEEMVQAGDDADTPETRALLRNRLADEREDMVVRYRALVWLLARDAPAVLDAAEPLLLVPHDPFRFALLDALAEHPTPALTPVLVRLFAEAGKGIPSGNPNVLRGRAAQVLAGSGDARAIDALEPMARSANPRNGTTHRVVHALGEIGSRASVEDADRIADILRASYPKAVDADEEASLTREERSAIHLVDTVTKALDRATPEEQKRDLPPLPKRWTKAARDEYLR